MRFTNTTGLPFQSIPGLTRDGQSVWIGILKASCKLDGVPEWTDDAPIQFVDEYYGDPCKSSLRTASDIVCFKPRSDIYLVDAVARTPASLPMRNWDVSVKVGELHSRYTVFSPSLWVRGVFARWRLETPELATEVPLRYEGAFGGAGTDGKDTWDENPVGRGYFSDLDIQSRNSIPAPQILDYGVCLPDRPTQLRTIAPCPVSVGWLPRRSLAGTFDEGWKNTRWPLFPEDSSDLFFCAAPAHLQFSGFLRGDEDIVLDGFTHDTDIRGKLPGGMAPVLIVPGGNGQVLWSKFVLDTLVINPEERSVTATWRACVFAPAQECQAIVLRNPVRGMPHA